MHQPGRSASQAAEQVPLRSSRAACTLQPCEWLGQRPKAHNAQGTHHCPSSNDLQSRTKDLRTLSSQSTSCPCGIFSQAMSLQHYTTVQNVSVMFCRATEHLNIYQQEVKVGLPPCSKEDFAVSKQGPDPGGRHNRSKRGYEAGGYEAQTSVRMSRALRVGSSGQEHQ